MSMRILFPPLRLRNVSASRKVSTDNNLFTPFTSPFSSTHKKREKYFSDIELPQGIVPVGSLHDAIARLDIPSCGKATVWEQDGVRYIRPSEGCPPAERPEASRCIQAPSGTAGSKAWCGC